MQTAGCLKQGELLIEAGYRIGMLDFSFKRIFGTEPNKDLLIALLNGIFRGRKHIVDLVYNKNEHVGDTAKLCSVIFDLTCTAIDGEVFIIEVPRS